jgi:hypothetical protein
MRDILSCMNYKKYQWPISSDLKVTAIWMALQKVRQNSVISYMNGIVVSKVFRAARGTGLNVNPIHLERRIWLISLHIFHLYKLNWVS